MSAEIEADEIHTPSRQVLRAARLRLDIVSVIYRQKHFLKFETVIFYLADSSPQFGRNFFAIIENSFSIPARGCLNLMRRVKLEMQNVWDERLWPLATLGLGKAGAVNKMIRFVNNMQMHSANDEDSWVRSCRFHRVSASFKEVSRPFGFSQFQPVTIIFQGVRFSEFQGV